MGSCGHPARPGAGGTSPGPQWHGASPTTEQQPGTSQLPVALLRARPGQSVLFNGVIFSLTVPGCLSQPGINMARSREVSYSSLRRMVPRGAVPPQNPHPHQTRAGRTCIPSASHLHSVLLEPLRRAGC